MTPKFSIVIPSFNHLDDCLRPCLESIRAYTDLDNVEIIVVANGCTDGTKAYVESLGRPFRLIWIPDKSGFIIPTNRGIEEASGDYIVLLNNDVILVDQPKNDWLNKLFKPFEKDRGIGITGPYRDVQYFWEGGRKIFHEDYIVFFCAMIKRDVFRTIGLLDPTYGMGYQEDIDFCIRAKQSGFRLAQVPTDVFYDLEITKEYILEHRNANSNFPVYHKDKMTFKDEPAKTSGNQVLEKYSKKPRYSIIIPTYNKLEDCLKPCIDSIIKNTDFSDVEIIIVANGCTDGTKDYVHRLGEPFRLFWIDEAAGYTRATNAGISVSRGEYIILLNNDNMILDSPRNEWLRILERPFLQDGKVGISGAAKDLHEPTNEEFLLFFCVMIKWDVIKRLGLLDEAFNPGFGEDIDYCIKARAAGYKTVQVPRDITISDGKRRTDHEIEFPLWHKGSQTVHGVDGWRGVVERNERILMERYGKEQPSTAILNERTIVAFSADGSRDGILGCGDALPEGWKPGRHSEIRKRSLAEIRQHVLNTGCKNAEFFGGGRTGGYMTQQNPEEVSFLINDLQGTSIKNYLEIGCSDGGMTRLICDLVDIENVHTIDMGWQDAEHPNAYRNNVNHLNNSGKVNIFRGNSHSEDARKWLAGFGRIFDCILIDADHTYESVKLDTALALSYAKPGCLVIFHDTAFVDELGFFFQELIEKRPFELDFVRHIVDFKQERKGLALFRYNPTEKAVTMPSEPKRSKVYDCFSFFNELDVLEIRLNELDEVVDRFVLCEARFTHQGKPKPLYFEQNKQRFAKFLHKIDHVVVDVFPPTDDTWVREPYQRNQCGRALVNCNDDDIIILSDIDEIPRADAVRQYRKEMGLTCIQTRLYYYKLNYQTPIKWYKLRIFPYSELSGGELQDFRGKRDYDYVNVIEDGGWHFSFMGDKDHIKQKIQSYAHIEFNNDKITSDDNILEAINKGRCVFGRDIQFLPVPIDESYPKFVRDNLEYFKSRGLIHQVSQTEPTQAEIKKRLHDRMKDASLGVYEDVYVHDSYRLGNEVAGKIIVDVGGFYGYFSIRCMELGAAKAYCFEPQPDNYKTLRTFTDQVPGISAFNTAVSDRDGQVSISKDYGASNLWGPRNPVPIGCISFEKAVSLIDDTSKERVLKLDCEGSEFDIIFNTPGHVLQQFAYIYAEIHDDVNPNYRGRAADLIQRLKDLGFEKEAEGPQAGWWSYDGHFTPSAVMTAKFRNTKGARKITIGYIDHNKEVFRQYLEPSLKRLDSKTYTAIGMGGTQSPAEKYNAIIDKSPNDLILLVHEDVGFAPDFLEAILHSVDKHPDFGFMGIVGFDQSNNTIWASPNEMKSLHRVDPCCVLINKRHQIRFDHRTFDELHCYVEDYCMQAVKGYDLKAYTIQYPTWQFDTTEEFDLNRRYVKHLGYSYKHAGGKMWGRYPEYYRRLIDKWSMSPLPIYSIIIPTYNHLDDCLKPCIDSIIKNTDLSNVEVVIVANGCTDGTKEYVQSLGHPFRLVWIDEAAGYTRATNEGIKAARGEYLILLNNDTYLLDYQAKNDWIDLMRAPFLSDPKTGITGPLKGYCPFLDASKHLGDDFMIFFCVMIPRKLFEEIGLLDELFSPGAGEDTDFCWRAAKAGYSLIQVPQEGNIHTHTIYARSGYPIFHASGSTRGEDNERVRINNYKLIKKHKTKNLRIIMTDKDEVRHGYFTADPESRWAIMKMDPAATGLDDKSVTEIILRDPLRFGADKIESIINECNRILVPDGQMTITGQDSKSSIYDCFLFYNELDLLDIRLHELDSVVDKFVLVESSVTFQGKPKPFYFEENKERFAKFLPKIIHIKVTDTPETEDAWQREHFQRNAITRGLGNCKDNDIIIVADVDEVPRAKALLQYRPEFGIMNLEQPFFYYYLNCKGFLWHQAKIMSYATLKTTTPEEVRHAHGNNQIPNLLNAGWHFSYLGNPDFIINKIEAFSHTEYNKPQFKDKEHLAACMASGRDLFNRFDLKFEEIDKSYPQYVQDNILSLTRKGLIKNLSSDPKYSIIIPTYNHLDDCLKPCIESIIRTTDLSIVEVIVVANGCTDGTRAYVESLGKPFKLIWMDEAGGYIKPTNAGLKEARGEFIILLNNDTQLTAQGRNFWLDLLEKPFQTPAKVGITGPRKAWHETVQGEYMLFFCVMFKRALIEEIGLLDEDFGIGYHEDIDFCVRVRKAGYSLVEVPYDVTYTKDNPGVESRECGFPILHYGGATFFTIFGHNPERITRNNPLLLSKHPPVQDRSSMLDQLKSELHKQDLYLLQKVVEFNSYGVEAKDLYGKNVIDVGAGVGHFAYLGCLHGAKKILAIESDDARFNKLGENYKNFSEVLPLKRKIVSSSAQRDMKSLSLKEALSYMPETDNDIVLKIACDGSEYDIIKGTQPHDLRRLGSVFIEVCLTENQSAGFEDLERYLTFWGFEKQEVVTSGDFGSWSIDSNGRPRFDPIVDPTRRIIKFRKNEEKVPRIYDCFSFFNELDLLELRMSELEPYVDYFVISEMTVTHSGKPKPLYFGENRNRFARFFPKIIHVVVNDAPETSDPWIREHHQRNCVLRGLSECNGKDVIIVSDLDEIPRGETICQFYGQRDWMFFEQPQYNYFLNMSVGLSKPDPGTFSRISTLGRMTELELPPTHLRYRSCAEQDRIPNGGWHFSWMGGAEKIIDKLESWAHQELNLPEYKNAERIAQNIGTGSEALGRQVPWGFQLVDIDETFPLFVRANKQAFIEMGMIKQILTRQESEFLTPRVAIVMPYYNEGPLAVKSVSAILSQTHQNWRLYVVDDGSSDDRSARNILENLASDDRIQIIDKSNGGPSSARNVALELIRNAKGFAYVAYCDADDVWADANYLASQLDNLRNCDVSYGEVRHEFEDGNIAVPFGIPNPNEYPGLDVMMATPFIFISSVVHNLDCLRVGEFDGTLNSIEDWDMWVRVAKAGYKFKKNNATYIKYVVKVDSNMASKRTPEIYEAFHRKHETIATV